MSLFKHNLSRILFALLLVFAGNSQLRAQTNISGTINIYTPVTSMLPCSGITVGSSAGFAVGDKVLIIQMKGATIDLTNTVAFGGITALNNAGNYEFATIYGIAGNNIFFQYQLLRTYTPATGLVQLVSVPQYVGAVNINATLTAQAWNGSTGGILVFEASGIVTMNATINVNGLGFRGGAASQDFLSGCSTMGYFWPQPSGFSGEKGEGIADPGVAFGAGMGRRANGGGGGNHVNAGGAGGGNYGLGGRGGDQWGGCPIIAIGGDPGSALTWNAATNRLYLGGGGGGGHQNNTNSTAGARGGGMVIVRAPNITGNGFSILANGSNTSGPAGIDGGGGGGAGGSIILNVPAYTGNVTLSAIGGIGSNAAANHGPGGGGGGGVVYHSAAALPGTVTTILNGGPNGTSGGAHGAAPGLAGAVINGLVIPEGTVPTFPTVNLGPDQSICSGTSVILDAGNPGSIYMWSTGANTQTISVSAAGTYMVTVISPAFCPASDTINISVNPLPLVNLGPDQSVCTGASVILDAGNPGLTYLWSTGEVMQTITASTTALYLVSVTDGNGCVGTDDINVAIFAPVVVNLGPDQSVCTGTNVVLNAGNPGATYLWSTTEVTQSITISANGNYSVTVTDVNGCTGTDDANVAINPLPIVNLGPDQNLCAGSSTTLDAGNPGSTYYWNDGSTLQTLNVTTSGTYIVTVTDVNGCSDFDFIDVWIVPLPVVNLGPDQTICQGVTASVDAGNPGSAYLWNTTEVTQVINPVASGNYIVTVTDGNGCTGTDDMNLTVNPAPALDLGPDQNICVGTAATLDAGNAGSTYSWSTGDNTQTINVSTSGNYAVTVTAANGCPSSDAVTVTFFPLPVVNLGPDQAVCEGSVIFLNAANAGSTYSWSSGDVTQIFNPLTTGNYSVTVTDVNGCQNSDNINITINANPLVDLGADTSICSDAAIMLDAENPGATYLWTGGAVAQINMVNSAGNYSVTVTSAEGCTGTDDINVLILQAYPLSLGPDTMLCGVDEYVLRVSFPAISILWPNGSTGPSFTVSTSGTYWVQTVTECEMERDSVNIEMIEGNHGPFLPNTFTPNGDGVNDELHIGGELVGTYQLMIFDRWGKLVYESQNISDEWDGTINGTDAPEGVYAIVLTVTDCNGLPGDVPGTVMLLR